MCDKKRCINLNIFTYKGKYILLIICIIFFVYLSACTSSNKNNPLPSDKNFTPTYDYLFSGNNKQWIAQLTQSGNDSQHSTILFVVFKGDLSNLPVNKQFKYTLSDSSKKIKLEGGGNLPNRISRHESFGQNKVVHKFKKAEILKLEINYNGKSELLELKNTQ